MSKEKYKIAFDSNILWLEDENKIDKLFSSKINDSLDFIKKNKIGKFVELAVPQLVVDERANQILRQIDCNVRKIENSSNALGSFGVKINAKLYKKKYEVIIKKKKSEQTKNAGFKIIKTSKIKQDEMIKRSLNGRRPFSDKGDKGFRDTLIWMSLLDDAKKNKNLNYIFCTENLDDFNPNILKEEFKEYSNKKIFIIRNTEELRELLDKNLGLNLKLKEIYKRAKKEISEDEDKIEYLMKKINSYEDNEIISHKSIWRTSNLKSREVEEYIFMYMGFDDIQEVPNRDNEFIISITVATRDKYKKDQSLTESFLHNLNSEGWGTEFHLTIVYSLQDKKIKKIENIRKGLAAPSYNYINRN